MRNVIPLAVLVASTFGLTLFLLVRGQSGNDSVRDAASTPIASVTPRIAPDVPVPSRESTAPATAQQPQSANRVAERSQAGDEEFTAEEIAQLIAADPEFGRAIAAMLADPNPEVRRNAAELFNAFLGASDTPAGGMPRRPD